MSYISSSVKYNKSLYSKRVTCTTAENQYEINDGERDSELLFLRVPIRMIYRLKRNSWNAWMS